MKYRAHREQHRPSWVKGRPVTPFLQHRLGGDPSYKAPDWTMRETWHSNPHSWIKTQTLKPCLGVFSFTMMAPLRLGGLQYQRTILEARKWKMSLSPEGTLDLTVIGVNAQAKHKQLKVRTPLFVAGGFKHDASSVLWLERSLSVKVYMRKSGRGSENFNVCSVQRKRAPGNSMLPCRLVLGKRLPPPHTHTGIQGRALRAHVTQLSSNSW